MRVMPKAALTAALTLPLVAALAAPAAADTAAGPFDCPRGEPVCLYLSGSFPITNPVSIPGTGTTARYFDGPDVCDHAGQNCITTWVAIPGTWVESTGGTIGTLDVPGIGIGITTGGGVTVYRSVPTFTPSGGTLGITASATTNDYPVLIGFDGIGYECGMPGSTTLGPLTTTYGGCWTTYTISL